MVQLQKLEEKVDELKKNKRSSTSSTGSKFQMESPTSSKHFYIVNSALLELLLVQYSNPIVHIVRQFDVYILSLEFLDLQLKREVLGSIPGGCPGFFLFQLAY